MERDGHFSLGRFSVKRFLHIAVVVVVVVLGWVFGEVFFSCPLLQLFLFLLLLDILHRGLLTDPLLCLFIFTTVLKKEFWRFDFMILTELLQKTSIKSKRMREQKEWMKKSNWQRNDEEGKNCTKLRYQRNGGQWGYQRNHKKGSWTKPQLLQQMIQQELVLVWLQTWESVILSDIIFRITHQHLPSLKLT